ncbi:Ankyrin repeat domain-containing protein [Tetrabaena socialis]|uniref:Ankyrin repeat domain-containing protein n=1 Tax=Tetrabaena socialis TaxID=47790 RepID=A0A2J8A9H9_9CHLO|nr:Ankyrin repeat domain-containing protein [Tetrabaena socialis]|eukprot:PNH09155.1 Ankyrin repeat domain-containing protein [Tetrabaena socialis]
MPPSATPQLPAVAQPSSVGLPYIWLPSVVQRLAELLPPNEVALSLRLVDKATAQQLRGPQHATVHLSQPVPHRDFVRRWAGPGAMRCLTRKQRLSLPCLVARSGSIANMEVLLAGDEAPGPINSDVLIAAASAGQKAVCGWLSLLEVSSAGAAVKAAASSGNEELCNWLLGHGCWWDESGDPFGEIGMAAHAAAPAATWKGHVGLAESLLQRAPDGWHEDLLVGAAAGLDLPILRRLKPKYFRFLGPDPRDTPEGPAMRCAVGAAAASDTVDWQAKVDWLVAQGCPLGAEACEAVASRPDALRRLQWLRQRGCPLSSHVTHLLAGAGNVEALQYVLDQGAEVAGDNEEEEEEEDEEGEEKQPCNCWLRAAAGGHVAVMELLHARGVPIDEKATLKAAEGGHLPALVWLVERLGPAMALTTDVFAAAAASGRVELLVWLRERGCPWDKMTFATAASCGSEEQIEWLAAQGCPVEDDGLPYAIAASSGELGILRCLRRVGCPWSSDGSTFTGAVSLLFDGSGFFFDDQLQRSFRWLLDEGCPVNWDDAEEAAAAEGNGSEDEDDDEEEADGPRVQVVLQWLREQRKQRERQKRRGQRAQREQGMQGGQRSRGQGPRGRLGRSKR